MVDQFQFLAELVTQNRKRRAGGIEIVGDDKDRASRLTAGGKSSIADTAPTATPVTNPRGIPVIIAYRVGSTSGTASASPATTDCRRRHAAYANSKNGSNPSTTVTSGTATA